MSKPNDGGPAFPTMTDDFGRSFCENKIDPENQMPFKVMHNPGISVRAYFACLAMQAHITFNPHMDPKYVVQNSLAYADDLIAELSKEAP